MNLYQKHVDAQLDRWHSEILGSAGLLERASKGIQNSTQKLIPAKVQKAITAAVETLVQSILYGSGFLSIQEDTSNLLLAERDFLVQEQFQSYKKAAVVQGVGLGAGGVILGLADLPTLMAIKIKFLFDSAKLYGYDPSLREERLFMLYVFQLAFSSREHRLDTFHILEGWESNPRPELDWEKFQTEYRDYIDLAKLLQLLPVVGSLAGGTANHNLMNRLKVNTMNCYRMRILERRWPETAAQKIWRKR
ncbi:EcsC family protein [Oscillospiraceae bacterium MB08-C2-2]|nr:EcsC family protein [Oscillospiraceae bacterium MB08-C2-2]